MLARIAPELNGITAQASSATVKVTMGPIRNRPLLAAVGNDGFLKEDLQTVGEGLQQAERAHHVGTATQRHGGPDLAVDIDDHGHREHHRQQIARMQTTVAMTKARSWPSPQLSKAGSGVGKSSFCGLRLDIAVQQFGRATLKRLAGPRDRVGQIEVGDRIGDLARRLTAAAGSAP
jgi:hypothetical protein